MVKNRNAEANMDAVANDVLHTGTNGPTAEGTHGGDPATGRHAAVSR